MRVVRPSGDYYDDFCEPGHPWIATNHAGSVDDSLLTEAERRAERKRRRDALAKKRPPGFAPWPEGG